MGYDQNMPTNEDVELIYDHIAGYGGEIVSYDELVSEFPTIPVGKCLDVLTASNRVEEVVRWGRRPVYYYKTTE